METKTVLARLPTGSKYGYLFLLSQQQTEGKKDITLTLSDAESAWHGQLSETELDELATKARMDFNTYVAQTMAAFTCSGDGGLSFHFQTRVNHDDSLLLIWKRQVPGEDIKFQLGSVVLKKKISKLAVAELFSHAVDNMQQLQSQIHSLETDNQRLSQERAMALKRLDKCVTAKEDLEKDLYFKFVNVLNSKKEKIRNLKSELEEGGHGTLASDNGGTAAGVEEEEDSEPETPKKKPPKSKPSKDMDESEENTDDEPVPASKRPKKTAAPVVAMTAEEALFLDDKDSPSACKVVRRPPRQRTTKKQTPVAPVLPRVSSRTADSSPGTSRRTSMRKSASNNSNRSGSGSAVDAEDLLDDL